MIHQHTITLAPKLTIHAIGEELVGALESIGELPALVALVALLVELDVAGRGPAGGRARPYRGWHGVVERVRFAELFIDLRTSFTFNFQYNLPITNLPRLLHEL